jgi:hypothetical protein
MSLAEILPAVQSLPHPDKLRLLTFLAGELAREEGLSDVRPDVAYPVWSPYDAFEAASTLERALQSDADRP